MYTDFEVGKFAEVVKRVANGGSFVINRDCGRTARALRRQFYRLKEQLYPADKAVAEKLIISVVGRTVEIKKRASWIDETGVTKDDSNDQGGIPPGDRQHDSSGMGGLQHEGVLQPLEKSRSDSTLD